jgi:Ca2+/Na+ antiporter
VIGLNFFASLGISGIMNTLFMNRERFKYGPALAYLISVLTVLFFFIFVAYEGKPSESIVRCMMLLYS